MNASTHPSTQDRYLQFTDRLAESMCTEADPGTWATKPDRDKDLWRVKAVASFSRAAFTEFTTVYHSEQTRLDAQLVDTQAMRDHWVNLEGWSDIASDIASDLTPWASADLPAPTPHQVAS